MKNLFNTVQMTKPNSNVFDLSYDNKLSLNMGELVPIHCMEIVPGDKISMSCESMLRFAPLIAPVMHKVDVTCHFFFVPNRLTWDGWEDFITADNTAGAPAAPYLSSVICETGTLGDYLGLPTGVNLDKVSALPFAAYQKIYNEYYRDQNLQDPNLDECVDGEQSVPIENSFTTLRNRAWQHDYFTSALPWAQKGDPVSLPIADIEIVATPGTGKIFDAGGSSLDGQLNSYNDDLTIGTSGGGTPAYYDPNGTLHGESTATTINDLRRAIKLQEFLEKDARGGSRYIEKIRAHFGVTSSDARLQRPEYLGGTKQPMVISEVLQTAEGAETPQGNMAGHGVSVGSGKAFSYFAEEHGYIIGIMSVMPKTAYQQGIPKHFSKFDKFEYFWPEFAHIGEQEILNREIYYSSIDGQNNAVFGYTPRYAEYKYNDSRVAGDFRTTLSYWHLGRIFSARPNLNSAFITSDPSTRVFAVEDPDVDKIYAHVFHRIQAVRRMPKFGTPSF